MSLDHNINEDIIEGFDEAIEEGKKKADRCLRIARRKYDKPSAYRSGAIVQCRRGKIWKNLKESDINEAPEDIKDLLYKAHDGITRTKGKEYAPDVHELQAWIDKYLEDTYSDLDAVYKHFNENDKVKYVKPNFEYEWEEAIRYPEFKEMGFDNWLRIAENGHVVNFSEIKDRLGNVDLDFDGLDKDKKARFIKALENGQIELPIVVKFSENDYDLVGGNTRLSGLTKNGIDPKIWVVDLSKPIDEAKKTDFSKEKKSGLHGWFSRRGGGGSKGWVDCNTCRTVDGKKKCKACGRQKGEKRAKYPSCRPTPASCGTPGKGKSWGKTKEEGYSLNEAKELKRVALLFIVIDNEALLFKRSESETTNAGKFGMLGGGIEKNETPEEAIVREIREEAGVELKSFKSLKKYIYDNECELNVFYTNEFPIDKVELNKKEHTSYKFFTMDQLMNMDKKEMIDSNKEIANDYNEIAKKKQKLEEELATIKSYMKVLG
jgi:8-oxo-dGTP diphosphatase